MDVAGFIDLLTDSGLDVTPLEVAEALWLARYVSPPPAGVQTPPGSAVTPAVPQETPGDSEPELATPPAPAGLPVYLPAGAAIGARQARLAGTGMPVPIPASTALPGSLGLIRELRPLKLRVPDARRRTLDEAATVSATASSGTLMPVLRAATERRFSLALVVDTGPAMAVWAKLEAELMVALQRLAAFRDLRRWYLHSHTDDMLGISHSARASPAPRDSAELFDPAGRRLILVLTDGAGSAWYSGAMARTLCRWGGGAPVAIVQPLPQQLWTRTALGPVRGRLTATRQAAPNAELMFTPRRRAPRWNGEPEAEDQAAVPVPVLGIGPGWLRGWARLVGGTPASTLDCAVTLASSGTATGAAALAPAYLSAEDRIRRFAEQASPEAQRLASYLAATPLSLPVMRHVQHAMLPGSGPSHLAEVLLGGLVTTSGVPGDHNEPRRWRYEFAPGVRDLLLSGLGRTDASRVLTTVSRDLNARLGRGADEFAGVVPLPGTQPAAAAGGPFAEISAQVMERITGQFSVPPARPPSGRGSTAEPSATLIRRYQRTGRVADIDAAIAALRDIGSELELAAALRARYLTLADPDDLDVAISLLRQKVSEAGTGSEASAAAEQLASGLGLRHARTRSPADIDDAVAAARLAAGPVTEQSDQFPRYAATLAGLLVRRGYPDDLAAAVNWLRRALTHQTARDDQARLLAALSVALRALAGASGIDVGADLDEAITSMRLAIQLSSGAAEPAFGSQARELAERQAALGGALLDRGQHFGNVGDLREAAECYRAAAALAAPGQPETAAYLAGQGIATRLLAAGGGRRDDADQAVRLMRQAVAETGAQDPELPRRQAELATSLIARFAFDGHRGDLLEARQLLAEAIATLTATLGARNPDTLAVRVGLARVAAADGRSAEARVILTDVLSSLPPSHPVYPVARALVESLR